MFLCVKRVAASRWRSCCRSRRPTRSRCRRWRAATTTSALPRATTCPPSLNGDGHRGGAGAHRLDHGAVADVTVRRGHTTLQGLPEDVAGTLSPGTGRTNIFAHRLHATEPGALVWEATSEGWTALRSSVGEAGRQEGVDGGDQVPGGDGVHAPSSRWDAPALRVEVARELAADRATARQHVAAPGPAAWPLGSGDGPLPVSASGNHERVLGVGGPRWCGQWLALRQEPTG